MREPVGGIEPAAHGHIAQSLMRAFQQAARLGEPELQDLLLDAGVLVLAEPEREQGLGGSAVVGDVGDRDPLEGVLPDVGVGTFDQGGDGGSE